ncbi:hypothetical protein K1718_00465 [Roseibium porphyridii]|uniref:Uncharacterized protein n=1 Tax=Roseibium porphyridii TaxID=2866279 RepID=A0ABY8F373_9HYPH|nr:hypothetical protein [Roseibium sp. KMA01]WFE89864.1 hypothetical protein K1718_00465 [Roseibium sp. KMA01]
MQIQQNGDTHEKDLLLPEMHQPQRLCLFQQAAEKGRNNGQVSISVAIGLPPLFSIRFGSSVPQQSDNDNTKDAKTG